MMPKYQIRVEKWIAPKDAKGDAKERIEVSYNLWADIVSSSGNRSDSAGQTKLNKSKTFKVRFRPDWKLSGVWKFVYLGKRYSITSIERINERRFNWIVNGES